MTISTDQYRLLPDQYRLLIVEDNEDHVVLIKRLLSKADLNVKVDVAGSAVEAMAALNKSRYHLILVDFGLPDCTGTASVIALKKQCSEAPIIVLTSSSERWLFKEALECGAEDIFVKSEVTPQMLSHAIRRACASYAIAVRGGKNAGQTGAASNEAVSSLQALIDRCTLTTRDMPRDDLIGELNSIRQDLVVLASKLEQPVS